jgi:hypothetical protein
MAKENLVTIKIHVLTLIILLRRFQLLPFFDRHCLALSTWLLSKPSKQISNIQFSVNLIQTCRESERCSVPMTMCVCQQHTFLKGLWDQNIVEMIEDMNKWNSGFEILTAVTMKSTIISHGAAYQKTVPYMTDMFCNTLEIQKLNTCLELTEYKMIVQFWADGK